MSSVQFFLPMLSLAFSHFHFLPIFDGKNSMKFALVQNWRRAGVKKHVNISAHKVDKNGAFGEMT